MTAANSLYQRLGGTSFPLDPAAAAADLSTLDPAQDILLELLAAAINAELPPRWKAAVLGTPLWEADPVQTKLPDIPDAQTLQQVGVKFPLLAVSRSEAPAQVEDFNLDQV